MSSNYLTKFGLYKSEIYDEIITELAKPPEERKNTIVINNDDGEEICLQDFTVEEQNERQVLKRNSKYILRAGSDSQEVFEDLYHLFLEFVSKTKSTKKPRRNCRAFESFLNHNVDGGNNFRIMLAINNLWFPIKDRFDGKFDQKVIEMFPDDLFLFAYVAKYRSSPS
jgi:hypothetical protein